MILVKALVSCSAEMGNSDHEDLPALIKNPYRTICIKLSVF